MTCSRTNNRERRQHRRYAVALMLAPALLTGWSCAKIQASPNWRPYGGGDIEFETKSQFSHIRIRKQGSVRTLLFVGQYGDEAVESAVDLEKPHELLVPYTRYMFASHLFKTQQQRVLMVGLGGGSMIRFLNHHDPRVQIDAVEIDPAIVKIAEEYFAVRSGGNIRIITADGVEYLETTETRYDIVYMDAFLRPRRETDSSGVPLRLKTARFLESVRRKLAPDGLVVFNLHRHAATEDDIDVIRSVFPQVYLFRMQAAGNLVVVASLAETRAKPTILRQRAAELDRRFGASFSFHEILQDLSP